MTGNPYRLYGRKNAGSLAVQIVLEEIGVPYELTLVSKSAADVESLRRFNPTGKIPVLLLPDGTAVHESAAIIIHLAAAHPAARLAPTPGSSAHARFLQWMVYLSANLYEAALRDSYAERYSTAGAATAAGIRAQAQADEERHLGVLHAALGPYLLGETYSAADAYLYMLGGWYGGDQAQLLARLPKLARHAELLRARRAVATADAAHADGG